MTVRAMILIAAGMVAGSIASAAADTPPATEPPKAHTDTTTIEAPKDPRGKAPPALTEWDESFLNAVYQTRITDRAQMAEIKTAMVQDVAP
jgi:hypothetical protein